ncbi:carbohydrate kinase family protein [Microbacterium sp. SSM24]|uniref:carbohydrate kinase family protein n=1 Tax=Microbacterium sp. SSM24 TaxID=2991714 RepID=UPI002227BAEB|nr:carbohydrate kinase family protein [Microbacterium sp. SSM24]MCW3493374.1 carbohydrate kinase family protein [Microbacterium sp. SSM24]
MSITVAGHLCVDLTPSLRGAFVAEPGRLHDVGPLRARLGGCVANTGRALMRAGLQTTLRADVGTDALASLVRDLARSEGFAADGLVSRGDASTSYSIVIESPGVDRSFWHHAGANDLFIGDDIVVDGTDILHLGYPSLLASMRAADGAALRGLFRRAADAGTATSLDLAVVDAASRDGTDWGALLDEVLPLTSIVSPSVDDLRSLASMVDPGWIDARADELARDLVRRGAAVAMVSAGADGLNLAVADEERLGRAGGAVARLRGWAGAGISTPAAPPTRIISTNGAGDAATAGLLAAVVGRRTPAQALESAARSAADAIAFNADDGGATP